VRMSAFEQLPQVGGWIRKGKFWRILPDQSKKHSHINGPGRCLFLRAGSPKNQRMAPHSHNTDGHSEITTFRPVARDGSNDAPPRPPS